MPYPEGKKWRATVMVNGKRATKLCPTKAEAIKWEVEKEKELSSPAQTPAGMELRIFFSKYLDFGETKFSRKVFEEKRRLLQSLSKKWGGGIPVGSVTTDMIASHLEARAKEVSNNEANKDRKNLLALWNWGVKRFDLPVNPVSKTDLLPWDRATQYTPPEKDVLKVLAVASGEEKVLLMAYLATAARRSEVLRWTWTDDINFDRREVRLGTRKTKNGSMEYEWLPMNDDLFRRLSWLWKNRKFPENDEVFMCSHGGRWYGKPVTVLQHFLERLCDRAEVKRFGYHALRRYVASMLNDKYKQSSKTVQRVLRHKNVHTTELYLKSINHDLAPVMNLLSTESQGELPGNLPEDLPETKKGAKLFSLTP